MDRPAPSRAKEVRRISVNQHSADRLLPPSISRIGTAVLLVFIAVPVLYLVLLALSSNSTVALGGTGLNHLT